MEVAYRQDWSEAEHVVDGHEDEDGVEDVDEEEDEDEEVLGQVAGLVD